MHTTIERPTTRRRLERTSPVPAAPGPRGPRTTLPCRVEDPDLWFAEAPAELEAAKEFCRRCPVQGACLAGALDRAEPWGVWGGEIFLQGTVVARKRPRGRPRKDAAA